MVETDEGSQLSPWLVTCFHLPSESTDEVFVPCKDVEMPDCFHVFCSPQTKDTKS